VKTLLQASYLLHQQNLAFELQVVGGEGDFRLDEAREFCKAHGIGEKSKILGPKYGEEKEQILADADIFVLPSENECFPLVILEAMRAGLPVVSTRVGGIPDLVQEGTTGLLVAPGSVEKLAAALHQLLADEGQRKMMGARGRQNFEDFYSLAHFRRNMLEVLLQIKKETVNR